MNRVKRVCCIGSAATMIALAGTSYEARANAAVPSHCRADEVNYFSCQIEGGRKVISLCGPSVSPGSDPAAGLEYRNGRPSSVALTLPPPKNNRPANFFRGEHLNPHGENLVVDSVLFEFDGVSYGIVVRDGRNKFTGAWTVGGRKKYEERPCTEKVDHGLFLDLVLELPLP